MLVIVFWWVVSGLLSTGADPELDWPRVSTLRKAANAPVFRRPTLPWLPNPARASGDLGALTSSRVPASCHPASEPANTTGRQSCPAATRAFSEVQTKLTKGSDGSRMLMSGPFGYAMLIELSWPR